MALSYEKYCQQRSRYLKQLQVNVDKKMPKSYIVRDGIIPYKLCLEPTIRCQCQPIHRGCGHVYYFLSQYLELSSFVITYLLQLPIIYEYFLTFDLQTINLVDLDQLLIQKIQMYFHEESCGVCLNTLSESKYQYEFVRCQICDKFTHKKCYDSWQRQQKDKSQPASCIYCGLSSFST